MSTTKFSTPITEMLSVETGKYLAVRDGEGNLQAWLPRNRRPKIDITYSQSGAANIRLGYDDNLFHNIAGVPADEIENTLRQINTLT